MPQTTIEGESELAGVVLETTPHGVMIWTGEAHGCAGYKRFELHASQDAWRQVTIFDQCAWKVMGCRARSVDFVRAHYGTHPEILNGVGSMSFELMPDNHDGLLQYSAKHAFKHMTLEKLQKLWSHLKIRYVGRDRLVSAMFFEPSCQVC